MRVFRRTFRIVAGFALLIAGFIMALPLVPGPGIAVFVAGLALLAEDFPWAQRAFDWCKQKWHKITDRIQKR